MNFRKTAQLTGHQAGIFALEVAQDERHFLSGAGDGWVAQWDIEHPQTGKLIAKIESQIFSVCFLKNENLLVIGNMNGGVHWVDLTYPSNTKNIAHHQKGVYDIRSFGGSVFTAGGDGKISRWSIAECRSTESYHLANQSLRCLDVCEKRQEIVAGGSDNNIYFLDAVSLELRNVIQQAHQNSVFSVRYTPDGRYLLSGGRDAHLKGWDLEHPTAPILSIPAHWFTINSIVFHPSGKLFATGSRDKTIKIWDTDNFQLLKVLEGARDGGHFHSINKLYWTKHKNTLISASDDRTMILWEST